MVVCGYAAESTSDDEGGNDDGTLDEDTVWTNIAFLRVERAADDRSKTESHVNGAATAREQTAPNRVWITPATSREAPEITNAG